MKDRKRKSEKPHNISRMGTMNKMTTRERSSDLYDNCYQIRKILPQMSTYDDVKKINFLYEEKLHHY